MPDPRTVHELDTPSLLFDRPRLERNIGRMASLASGAGVQIRPHIKTHKSVTIARMQAAAGASGITCAKTSEAELFARHGFSDIVIAHPAASFKGERLRRVMEETGARIAPIADSHAGIERLSSAFRGAASPLEVLVEVDVGFGRTGVPVHDVTAILELARAIESDPGLRFAGILTHAGHAYGAESSEQRAAIGRAEGEDMAALADRLREAGLEVGEVSVGSTPSVEHAAPVPGVTEVRPGNYVFFDATQMSLGVATHEDCALTVLATVVSRPADDRAACDAGSKVFSSDRGAHGKGKGDFGLAMNERGDVDAGVRLHALSEEHGWLRLEPGHPMKVGQRARFIPAHACVVMNLARVAWVVDGDDIVDRWTIDASGCVQ